MITRRDEPLGELTGPSISFAEDDFSPTAYFQLRADVLCVLAGEANESGSHDITHDEARALRDWLTEQLGE